MASKVRKNPNGFTLIEIIITVGISLFLMSFVIGNYNRYNETQKLKQTALTLKNNFRFLQSKASAGEKPVDPTGTQTPDEFCRQLVGYQVNVSDSFYSYQAQCSPVQPNAPITTLTLPDGITFTLYPSPFSFRVLTRGTTLTGISTIRLSTVNNDYSITVSPSGDISDLGAQ